MGCTGLPNFIVFLFLPQTVPWGGWQVWSFRKQCFAQFISTHQPSSDSVLGTSTQSKVGETPLDKDCGPPVPLPRPHPHPHRPTPAVKCPHPPHAPSSGAQSHWTISQQDSTWIAGQGWGVTIRGPVSTGVQTAQASASCVSRALTQGHLTTTILIPSSLLSPFSPSLSPRLPDNSHRPLTLP